MTIKNLFFSGSLGIIPLLIIGIIGNISFVIEFHAIAMLICALFLTLAGQQPGKLFAAIRAGFNGQISSQNSDEMIEALKQFENILLLSGFACILFSMINLLANIAQPSLIGPNIALALNCSIYSMIGAKFIIMPLRLRLINTQASQHRSINSELLSGLLMLGFPFANYALITIVLYSVK